MNVDLCNTIQSALPAEIRVPLCSRDAAPRDLYAACYAIRKFEQSLLDLFGRGLLNGTTHTCLGQESTAVGVISALDRDRDIVFSNHRGHGHFLAYCGAIEELFLEVMGKPSGVCAGRGGSQHLRFQNFFSNGVQGGIAPVASGMALAEKINGTGAVTVVFLGDGTLGEGAVYEAFNVASLWSIPILFVVDDNQYAQSTPRRMQMAGSLVARLEAFGIQSEERTTTDTAEVISCAAAAVDSIRESGRPRALVLHTYRLGPHSKGDDTRDPEEIKAAWINDPLAILKRSLSAADVNAVEGEMGALVAEALRRALLAPDYE